MSFSLQGSTDRAPPAWRPRPFQIARPHEPRVLVAVPRRQWMPSSQSVPRDQCGLPSYEVLQVLRARLPDGSIRWEGSLPDRHDADAVLEALLGLQLAGLPVPLPLRRLPTPEWDPGLAGLPVRYELVTKIFITATGASTFNWPVDWVATGSELITLAGGGSGGCIRGTATHATGGGAAAINRKNNYAATPGASQSYTVGTGGAAVVVSSLTSVAGNAGADTFIGASLGAAIVGSKAGGGGAVGAGSQNGGLGGVGASGVGDNNANGGRAGNLTGASGQGGSGGGGAGGLNTVTNALAAGANAADSSSTSNVAGNGAASGGNSPGGAGTGSVVGDGGDGSNGSVFLVPPQRGAGGGAGASSTTGAGTRLGGSGGLYGGGGGANCHSQNSDTVTAKAGGQGLIYYFYHPLFSNRNIRARPYRVAS